MIKRDNYQVPIAINHEELTEPMVDFENIQRRLQKK